MTRVISIQSQVIHGHVGNSAAVFPMQSRGIEVAAVPTALLSNHPHYPTMRGKVFEPDFLADLLQGVEERDLPRQSDAILTGYLGSVGNAGVVAAFIRRARQANPHLRYVCDPVMGDDDLGVFVKPELIGTFRDDLAPLATVVTPNQFELELLSGRTARSARGLAEAAQVLATRGTGAVVVTGCALDDTPGGMVETVVWQDGTLDRTATPRLPIRPCGTGDLFTGLMTAHLCLGLPLKDAAAEATRQIFAVLERTAQGDPEEMAIAGFPGFTACPPVAL